MLVSASCHCPVLACGRCNVRLSYSEKGEAAEVQPCGEEALLHNRVTRTCGIAEGRWWNGARLLDSDVSFQQTGKPSMAASTEAHRWGSRRPPGMSGRALCSLESAGRTVIAKPTTVLVLVLVLVPVLVPVALSLQADSFLTSVASSYRRVDAATASPWTSPDSDRRSLRTSQARERASEGPLRAASCRGKAGSSTLNGTCRQTLEIRYTESTRCKHGKPTWT